MSIGEVWIVTGGWNYEGSEVVGVYSDEESAEKEAEALRNKKYTYDIINVNRWIVE